MFRAILMVTGVCMGSMVTDKHAVQARSFDGCQAMVPPPYETVDFDRDVQPIFDAKCVQCHQAGSPDFGQHRLDLRPAVSWRSLVEKPSVNDEDFALVRPFAPDGLPGSLLWWKVSCSPPPIGSRMPVGEPPLSSAELRTLYIWMMRGAPPGIQAMGVTRSIEEGHSGTWYDPSLPGHGFSFEVLPGETARFVGFWMTFDRHANQRWLLATGEFPNDSAVVELDVMRVDHGRFETPHAMPNSTLVGEAVLTFHSCTEATMRYDIELSPGSREQGTVVLRRLTPSQSCVP